MNQTKRDERLISNTKWIEGEGFKHQYRREYYTQWVVCAGEVFYKRVLRSKGIAEVISVCLGPPPLLPKISSPLLRHFS